MKGGSGPEPWERKNDGKKKKVRRDAEEKGRGVCKRETKEVKKGGTRRKGGGTGKGPWMPKIAEIKKTQMPTWEQKKPQRGLNPWGSRGKRKKRTSSRGEGLEREKVRHKLEIKQHPSYRKKPEKR